MIFQIFLSLSLFLNKIQFVYAFFRNNFTLFLIDFIRGVWY